MADKALLFEELLEENSVVPADRDDIDGIVDFVHNGLVEQSNPFMARRMVAMMAEAANDEWAVFPDELRAYESQTAPATPAPPVPPVAAAATVVPQQLRHAVHHPRPPASPRPKSWMGASQRTRVLLGSRHLRYLVPIAAAAAAAAVAAAAIILGAGHDHASGARSEIGTAAASQTLSASSDGASQPAGSMGDSQISNPSTDNGAGTKTSRTPSGSAGTGSSHSPTVLSLPGNTNTVTITESPTQNANSCNGASIVRIMATVGSGGYSVLIGVETSGGTVSSMTATLSGTTIALSPYGSGFKGEMTSNTKISAGETVTVSGCNGSLTGQGTTVLQS